MLGTEPDRCWEPGTHRTNQLVKCTRRSDREGNPQGIPGELGFGWRGLGRPLGDLRDGEEAKHAKGGEERSGGGNRKYEGPEAAKSSASPGSEGQRGEGPEAKLGRGPGQVGRPCAQEPGFSLKGSGKPRACISCGVLNRLGVTDWDSSKQQELILSQFWRPHQMEVARLCSL